MFTIGIFGWFVCAILCAALASNKNKSMLIAFICGAIFGVLALVYYCFCKSN